TGEWDYVTIRPHAEYWAYANIGRIGGQQFVTLGVNNSVGVIVHELGHTLGFWHEQTRPDRDQHVTIHWGNIIPGMEGNFATYASGLMVGPYDIDSIMHYPSYEFSRNGYATITRKNGTSFPTNYAALSAGDIAAIAQLYGDSSDERHLVIDSNNDRNDMERGYVEVSESWTASSATPSYFGTGYWFAEVGQDSGPATFWFLADEAGAKTIEAWWTAGDNRSPRAQF